MTAAPALARVQATAERAPGGGRGLAQASRRVTLLSLAFALPLVFNPFGTLAFEPFKVTLLRLGAIGLVLSYAAELWRGPTSGPRGNRLTLARPVVLACLGYASATGLATVWSVDPLQSLLGSYHRLQGLLTLLSLLVVAFAVAASRESRERVVDCLLIGSLPVCLYALAQQFKLDPLPWLDRTLGPASTIGSSTALGGYLAMLVPLSLARAANSAPDPSSAAVAHPLRLAAVWRCAGFLGLACLQVSLVIATGVRGSLLGLAAGLAVLALLLLARGFGRGRPWLLGLLGSALLATVALNLSGVSLEPLRSASPYVERLAAIGPDDLSGRERVLIWRAAVETWATSGARLLVGYGGETQAQALEARFPIEIANRQPDLRFDRVHNELLDQLLTSGVLGLAAYLGVICTSAVVGWRALPRAANPWLLAALLAAVAAHLVESAFAFGSVSTLLVFWLGLGMLAGHTPGRTTWRTADPGPPRPAAERPQSARRAAAAATAVVALCSLPAVLSPVLADLAYTRALAHYGGENPSGQVAWLRRAAALAPDRDLYLVALGLTLAQEAKDEPSDGRRVFLLDQAEAALRQAVSKKSGEPYNHFHLGQVLQIRAEANHLPGALSDAINSQERAAELSPSRATLVDAAGMALQRQGRAEEALVRYSRATELQGPDAERLARMGDCLVALGSYEQAHEMYEAALKLTPRSATAHAGLAELLRRQGDPAAAVESARLAARFQSREWRYREMLALLERDSGNQEEALLEARAAVRFAPPWEQERLRELVAELRAAN